MSPSSAVFAGATDGALFSRTLALLDSWSWDIEVDRAASDGVARALLEPASDLSRWPLLLVVPQASRRVLFYSVWPDRVPEERRAAVMEVVARVNDGLLSGAAEISIDDGDLRIRTSAIFGEAEPRPLLFEAVVRETLDDNLALAARYFPVFDAVITNGAEPAASVARAESD